MEAEKTTDVMKFRVHSIATASNDIICDKNSLQKDVIDIQLEGQTGEKPNGCIYCDKAFQYKSQLDRHMAKHTKEKTYWCNHCNKAFSHKCNLVKHLMALQKKPYQCIYCNKAFSLKSDSVIHQRIHTGEKPYQCMYCAKAFSQKNTLVIHLRNHTGEKPYQCSHCEKAFSTKNILKIHMRKHTGVKPYQCTHCNKAFTYKEALERHLVIHDGGKTYECSICDKAYQIKSSLLKHMKKHTREKQYQCRYCYKAFLVIGSLNSHLVRQHGKEGNEHTYYYSNDDVSNNYLSTHSRPYLGEKQDYFQCPLCNYSTSNRNNFKKHLQDNIGQSKSVCSSTFSPKTQNTNHTTHIENKYPRDKIFSDMTQDISKVHLLDSDFNFTLDNIKLKSSMKTEINCSSYSEMQDLAADISYPLLSTKQELDDVQVKEEYIIDTLDSIKQEF